MVTSTSCTRKVAGVDLSYLLSKTGFEMQGLMQVKIHVTLVSNFVAHSQIGASNYYLI